jgi:glycosyltransferase involved in cell wall biosynthesis
MKVLFIAKGKGKSNEISPFIKSQADSLIALGIKLNFFVIKGEGLKTYVKHALSLKAYLKENQVDIIHAHYGLCGWTAVLALARKPVIVSLMGSDVLGEHINQERISIKSSLVVFSTFILQFFVKGIITKSLNIQKKILFKRKSEIIPNGVNTDRFNYLDVFKSRAQLGLDEKNKFILFLGNPEDQWKNVDLAKTAISALNNNQLKLLIPYPIAHNKIANYINASDLLLITSFMEGSSNVIKEAMSCNCPIVTTDVGDAKWVIGKTPGCFVTTFDPNDIALSINSALDFSDKHGRTCGRDRIIELGLDSKSIANRIFQFYKKLLKTE